MFRSGKCSTSCDTWTMSNDGTMREITAAPALRVIYRDDDLLAVCKPAGLLVHRSPIDRRETRFALQLARELVGRRVYPVHRLDKPTAGLLLFALHPDAARQLAHDFAYGAVAKRYLAVVRGYLPAAGTIDAPLAAVEETRTSGQVPRPAVTDYRTLATVELPEAVGRYPTSRYSLAELTPYTGRRHQLRRHLKHIFHPIVGDTRYGEGRHNRFFRERYGCHHLLLAAVEATIRHPRSGEALRLTASLPEEWRPLLGALGWEEVLEAAWRPLRKGLDAPASNV